MAVQSQQHQRQHRHHNAWHDSASVPWSQRQSTQQHSQLPRRRYKVVEDERRACEQSQPGPKMSASSRLSQQYCSSRSGGGEIASYDKQGLWRPHPSEVVAAVDSLYLDKLKPFGRILLKRVRERSAAALAKDVRVAGNELSVADVEAVPLIDPKCLRRICENCSSLRVEPEDGKEYSVLLVGQPRVFVDVCSPEDSYPPEMWAEGAAYFESLEGEDMRLPGGRYACAQVLLMRQLPFLEGRSLGEICHLVQLAVSQKRILGYWDGNMVPFGRSVDCIKEQCAVWQQPVNFKKTAAPDLPLATWEQARACLWEILESASMRGQPGVITLSNVKRLFRSRFNLELSETALGHSRLNELLQDVRLSDICKMELQGKSQVVVQRMADHSLHDDAGLGGACSVDYWQALPWSGAEAYLADVTASTVAECCGGLDPHALPWSPGLPVDGGGFAGPSTAVAEAAAHDAEEEEPSKDVLSDYLQKLLELDDQQGRDALQQLSTYTLQATDSHPPANEEAAVVVANGAFGAVGSPVARGIGRARSSQKRVRVGGNSRRSSLSASRSTSDAGSPGSPGQGSDDGDEDDSDGDADGANSAGSGFGKDPGPTLFAMPSMCIGMLVPPPTPPAALASPPGL
mmetsp:Transcript_39908/g.106363  ORF Transcript_39908/g.106363 Transcript_39908/m.106363 type:complete len:629 (-) Transcript_39908:155-2041(-)